LADESNELNRSLDKFLRVGLRRRWWVLATACTVTLIASLGSFVLPSQYRSEATILVEQQQIPERYVTPNITSDLNQALEAMTQDVLSRPRLLQIISEFDLYPDRRERLAPEEIAQLMRQNIEIEPLAKTLTRGEVNAFKISFTGDTARTTQLVASRLTSLFIEENLKTREQQATGTTNFLQGQLSAAEAQLQETGHRLRDFKMQHLGELPEQQQGNLGILAGLHAQLQNTMGSLSRAQEQQVYLESMLTQYRRLAAIGGGSAPGVPGLSVLDNAERELTRLKSEKTALQARYSANHPEVRRNAREIAETEALLEHLKKAPKADDPGTGPVSSPTRASDANDATLAPIISQLEGNRALIKNATLEEKRLEAQIAEYQRRLNLTPVREQQLAELLRDYDLAQKNYADLEGKRTQSELATKLEKNQQGRQFRIVDPANLPAKPITPDRPKIGLLGAFLGLGLGVALAGFVEVRDSSFRSEGEVSQHFTLPLVVGIPRLFTPAEERRRTRTRILEWVAGSLLFLAALAAEFVVYRRG
jgi:succinoglycan biosynthesis transport protein ExoP